MQARSRYVALIVSLIAAAAAGPVHAGSLPFTDTVDGTKNFTVAATPLGGVAACTIQTGVHTYQTRAVTANYTGAHTFTVTASSETVTTAYGDPFLALYAGSFNPASPTTNLVGCDDDSAGSRRPRFTANLTSGQTYVLVATTFRSNAFYAGTTPQGTVTYSGDSGGGNADLTLGASGSGGGGAPAATMPAAGLVMMAGLLALFGARRLRRR